MRKLKTEKRFREQRAKKRNLIAELREHGKTEAEIQSYLQMLNMSQMIEMAANDLVARKNTEKAIQEKDGAVDVPTEEESQDTQETDTTEKEDDVNVQG